VLVEIDGNLARAGDRVLILSRRELDLLAALSAREGLVVGRAELYESVWGTPLRPDDRSVDVYVHKLRGKLAEAQPGWECIHTHFGFGYRFQPERSHAFHNAATTS
jgi:DNA-binding response OmpR family regulator